MHGEAARLRAKADRFRRLATSLSAPHDAQAAMREASIAEAEARRLEKAGVAG